MDYVLKNGNSEICNQMCRQDKKCKYVWQYKNWIDVVLKHGYNLLDMDLDIEYLDGIQKLIIYNKSFIFCLILDISYSLYKLPLGLYSSINLYCP